MLGMGRHWIIPILASILILGLFSLNDAFAVDPPSFVLEWGDLGALDGQLDNPLDVEFDSAGNVYVVDTLNFRIQKFTDTGTFILKWGSPGGNGDDQFLSPNGPVDVAVSLAGDVYIVDTGNQRVQKFDSSGTFQGWLGMCTFGSNCDVPNLRSIGFSCSAATCSGTVFGAGGVGQFDFPRGVAVDSTGNVYVVDVNNNRIQKFDSSGTFLTQWGSFGFTDGLFNSPQNISVDSAGNVYVVDTGNDRIQKFTDTGTFLTKWGGFGSLDGELDNPQGVKADSFGNVYVTDPGNDRIQKFDSNGVFLTKWGSFGSGPGQFSFPVGVGVDSVGDVYVVDQNNDRIQKFAEAQVAIGGTILPIDTTALLVAGAQTMTPWLILGVVTTVGIGLAVFTLKRSR